MKIVESKNGWQMLKDERIISDSFDTEKTFYTFEKSLNSMLDYYCWNYLTTEDYKKLKESKVSDILKNHNHSKKSLLEALNKIFKDY